LREFSYRVSLMSFVGKALRAYRYAPGRSALTTRIGSGAVAAPVLLPSPGADQSTTRKRLFVSAGSTNVSGAGTSVALMPPAVRRGPTPPTPRASARHRSRAGLRRPAHVAGRATRAVPRGG